ncbi:efflux RND transporter periplasmic adaptor subunit [Paraflavisolibacter sp. H34]|uniref:efflux RND transporter periplasmic adaptor subunit n=1 Tax=Huijunlia imazamoxiresistens TaxID=3127457 RepID=UPI003015FAF5
MKLFSAAALVVLTLLACTNQSAEHGLAPAEAGQPGEARLEPLAYTLYSDTTELFVEFKPLVVGSPSKFAAHLTRLGETFTPYTEGAVTVSLQLEGRRLSDSAGAPSSPGIFRLALTPAQAGVGRLVFDIRAKGLTDQITIDSVPVYTDEKTALAAQVPEAGGSDIAYLKEQAWKVEFAHAPVRRTTLYDVVPATGELLDAPGEEVTVAARSNGLVTFAGTGVVVGAPVRGGQKLFSISGGEIAFENVAAAKQAARAELATAKTEYDRASELITDQLITQGEYQAARLRYQQARIALAHLSRNYSRAGNALTAPISGFLKNVLVSEGQYVQAGQPLATLTRNRKLLLRADVSLKDAGRIASVREANFTLVQNKQTYNTGELNGKLVSIAKTTGGHSPFVPVHFELDSRPGLLPGSFAQVYLKTTPLHNVLAVPVSALLEEQGTFFVYVQTAGESFQKREVRLGAQDGRQAQVLSGVAEGERVVTRGAYQIKLSTAGGTMPAHGHEH